MKANMFEVSKFVKWSVAGDGNIHVQHKNGAYSISRHPQHKDYIEKIKEKLQNLPDCFVRIREYARKDNGKEVVSLATTVHPLFTRIYNRQYIHNHRVIEPHMLSVVDWECLAFLYMDDGSLCLNNKGSLIVRISTCAYSYPEQDWLRKCFIEKFGIVFNINKAGKGLYQLNLRTSDHSKFFDGIEKYIVRSYKYKLPGSLQEETSRPDDDIVYSV